MPAVPAHIRRQRLVTFTALMAAVITVALAVSTALAGLWP